MTRLRRWLIALIREAVRAELEQHKDIFLNLSVPAYEDINWNGQTPSERAQYPGSLRPANVPRRTKTVAPVPQTEYSFEQMQEHALREQEKFYAERE